MAKVDYTKVGKKKRDISYMRKLKMRKVGPSLWLSTTKPRREVLPDKDHRWYNYKWYKKGYKKLGKYINATGGWSASRLILIGGWCFEVSDRPHSVSEVKRVREAMRKSHERKRRKAAETVQAVE